MPPKRHTATAYNDLWINMTWREERRKHSHFVQRETNALALKPLQTCITHRNNHAVITSQVILLTPSYQALTKTRIKLAGEGVIRSERHWKTDNPHCKRRTKKLGGSVFAPSPLGLIPANVIIILKLLFLLKLKIKITNYCST